MATELARILASGGVAALAALGFSTPAAADTMRCGSRLVSDGDSIDKVLALCGEPTSRSRTWIVRQPRFSVGSNEYSFPGREDVPVDLWTYDLGPNKLVRRLRFIAGELQTVETLGPGTPGRG